MIASGMKPAKRETYVAKEPDFSALISKMKDAKIDVVYIGGYRNDPALTMRQGRFEGDQVFLVHLAGRQIRPRAD